MAETIINGKVYIIYENLPTIEPNPTELLMTEMRKQEKKSREQDWKQRARKGYRKK